MSTHSIAQAPGAAIPQPELHLAGRNCVTALVLLGLRAGGLALVSAPDGSVMQMDVALLAGSPFADYTVPGLILGGLFGSGRSSSRAWGWPTCGSRRSWRSGSGAPEIWTPSSSRSSRR